MSKDVISIRSAKENNLKGIDLDIPRNQLVVITGVSGSGKSSLAFDTLFAEGQRRFAESLSSFARQFLGKMSKPNVESISGIPPAVAIDQKVNSRNPRSTVGTTTEIIFYLRLLFSKIGKTYSPISGEVVSIDSAEKIIDSINFDSGETIYITSDIKLYNNHIEKLLNLREEGFIRLLADSDKIVRVDEVLSNIDKYLDKELELLVDRILVDKEQKDRIFDSLRIAFEKGEGDISIISDGVRKRFSNRFERDGIKFQEPSEYLFNYNNPLGACQVCGGYGKIIGIDEDLVVPNKELSVYEDAIACWRGNIMKYYKEEIISNSIKYNFPIHTPYLNLTPKEKKLIWEGNDDIYGIDRFFKELEEKTYKIQNKYMLSRYSGKTLCPECNGSRLRKEALYIKVGGKDIDELTNMSIENLYSFFDNLSLSNYENEICAQALKEIKDRLSYIINVGLPYLTLSRASNTLSGGESQRIRLVSSLGNSLTGSMYILDEPSIGLHERDTRNLISVLKKLRDLGNTVIVVEHDEEIIRSADYLIDIGPLAGKFGGEIVFEGIPPKVGKVMKTNSLTIDYLCGIKKIEIASQKRISNSFIEIIGASENNLKNIDVKFPLKAMTAVVGVSGSGKSTLIGSILYPALNRYINQVGDKPGKFKKLSGSIENISAVEFVDQNPIGKSSRSNPVTYLKIYDDIRKLFSEQPYAKLNNYGHSHFSFNIDGGRCPECLGEGTIKIPMQFMADIVMTCESCQGRRFKADILEVKYQGKNITDILDFSVDQAIDFFSSQSEAAAQRIARKLKTLQDVGLGYICLGQSSSTLSGGESQRVKLAYFLSKENTKDSNIFIFDEPTTGLHFEEIGKLLKSFNALLDKGNTIIIIEHNPYIIEAADYIIELGPEGGEKGGYLIKSI